MTLQVVSLTRPFKSKKHGIENNKVMAEHLQSDDQAPTLDD